MALGQPAKAAELFMRAEDPDSAAQAFEQAGEIVKAATLRGEVALKADRVAEAAAFFQQGQDYLRAAELFESIGMLAEAAGAYEAGDSFVAAGGVYVRAGLKDRAAASYEKGGEFETAAKFYEEAGNDPKAIELYEKAGLTFKSGEAAAKAGDRDTAIALLQRVAPQDENYRPATELLARLFIEAKMPGLAVERLQRALGSEPVSAANLDLYYWLGAGFEASGNGREALGIYKKILAEDLRFRDVEKRVARLEAAGAARPPTPASAPAAPAGRRPPLRRRRSARQRRGLRPPKPRASSARRRSAADPWAPSTAPRTATTAAAWRFASCPRRRSRGEGVQAGLVADLKAASQLSHPNLVKVLGFIDLGGERGVVTELVSGRNFAEALKGGHKMTFQQVHSLGRLLAQALAFIHGKGLVHGSIQPSNVMVAAGVVKIADLGLGRVAFPVAPKDNYRAPENQLDAAGDLYAMAAVLYHLLTRRPPQDPGPGRGPPAAEQARRRRPGGLRQAPGAVPAPQARAAIRPGARMCSPSSRTWFALARAGRLAPSAASVAASGSAPRRARTICAHCCGTKRRVEIDCPSDCAYLTGSHAPGWEGRETERRRDARRLAPFVESLSDVQARLLFLALAGIAALRARRRDLDDALLLPGGRRPQEDGGDSRRAGSCTTIRRRTRGRKGWSWSCGRCSRPAAKRDGLSPPRTRTSSPCFTPSTAASRRPLPNARAPRPSSTRP